MDNYLACRDLKLWVGDLFDPQRLKLIIHKYMDEFYEETFFHKVKTTWDDSLESIIEVGLESLSSVLNLVRGEMDGEEFAKGEAEAMKISNKEELRNYGLPRNPIHLYSIDIYGPNQISLVKKDKPVPDKWHTLEKAKVNLGPKIDHLTKQIARIGVKTRLLRTEELVEFFYDLYNPEVSREQKAALNTTEYTTPIVEPALQPTQAEGSESTGEAPQ